MPQGGGVLERATCCDGQDYSAIVIYQLDQTDKEEHDMLEVYMYKSHCEEWLYQCYLRYDELGFDDLSEMAQWMLNLGAMSRRIDPNGCGSVKGPWKVLIVVLGPTANFLVEAYYTRRVPSS